jgi:hypothetical protein
MPARQYRSTVEAKTLNQTITNSSTAIVLNSVTTLPTTYPYTLVLNPDTLTEEIVTVTSSGGGNTLNVTRGQDGTTAQAHNLGAAVRHMITARDLQEPQDHINNGGYHIIVCTSSTRPGSPVDGQHIYETDTDKTLSWDGTAWNPVSGAAAYQAGEPANPSVGSLWVDSDETASQLNTNDFLLKADASAASGYVSKVGGDTVVASGAAVKPLVLKGASSQTANLQEWQDSTGAVVASVSPTGNIVGSGLTLLNTTTFSGVSSQNVPTVFSAKYENYRIVYKISKSTSSYGYIRLLVGTTPDTGSNNYAYGAITSTGDSLGAAGVNTSAFFISPGDAQAQFGVIDLIQPFLTDESFIISSNFAGGFGTDAATRLLNGKHRQLTSFNGFQLVMESGTMSGKVFTYGYNN